MQSISFLHSCLNIFRLMELSLMKFREPFLDPMRIRMRRAPLTCPGWSPSLLADVIQVQEQDGLVGGDSSASSRRNSPDDSPLIVREGTSVRS